MKKGKKFELCHILSLFKIHSEAKKVAKELGISKTNMSYYTKKLKDLSVLKYVSKGTWDVTEDLNIVQKSVGTHSPLLTKFLTNNPKKEIRGHAFIWKIQFSREFDWKRLLDNSSLKKKYKIQSSGKVLRIIFQGRKIWLQRKGTATIFEPFDYFGKNAYQSKGLAVYNLDKLLKTLLEKLNNQPCNYKFTTSRVHYALIKNELARQFNDRGEKLHIKTETGTDWLWLDFSKGDGEFEVGNLEEDTEEISKVSQDWWNDNKKTKFKVTPTLILDNFKETSNQIGSIIKMRNEDFKSIKHFGVSLNKHIPAYEGMRDEAKGIKESNNEIKQSNKLLTSAILELKNEIRNISKK